MIAEPERLARESHLMCNHVGYNEGCLGACVQDGKMRVQPRTARVGEAPRGLDAGLDVVALALVHGPTRWAASGRVCLRRRD